MEYFSKTTALAEYNDFKYGIKKSYGGSRQYGIDEGQGEIRANITSQEYTSFFFAPWCFQSHWKGKKSLSRIVLLLFIFQMQYK